MFDPQDIGTRFDAPASVDDVAAGTPATLFALLKGLLLHLAALLDGANG